MILNYSLPDSTVIGDLNELVWSSIVIKVTCLWCHVEYFSNEHFTHEETRYICMSVVLKCSLIIYSRLSFYVRFALKIITKLVKSGFLMIIHIYAKVS